MHKKLPTYDNDNMIAKEIKSQWSANNPKLFYLWLTSLCKGSTKTSATLLTNPNSNLVNLILKQFWLSDCFCHTGKFSLQTVLIGYCDFFGCTFKQSNKKHSSWDLSTET